MMALALEASSATESAALLDGERLLASRRWAGDRAHARFFFDAIRGLLAETGLAPDRIEAFAVGLGPGSFTGLRMALAAAQGMALPGGTPVFGLSSAAAAAVETALETGGSRVLVCGDARRNRVWSGLFETRPGRADRQGGWRLDPLDALPGLVAQADAVCTADWDALAAPLRAACQGGSARLVPRALQPAAETVGRLAAARLRLNLPSLPLTPIYLHPPVFVPPSFPPREPVLPAQEPA